jgi:hypothetical protein
MNNLQSLETPALIDILAQHTADYTKMLTEGGTTQEFEKCKMIIKAIQLEIEVRNGANTSVTNNDISFTE